MNTTPTIKKIYEEIQKKLFYMIPEKWERIYLYASVEEAMNNMETGEMYFYYFPKGILKKDPVNVYEIPSKFNLDETDYFKLADQLYGIIKKLRKEYINKNDKIWTNIIISIENSKFKVEYGFEDFRNSQYNSYDRHIIFRYKYLNTGINTYNKKERGIIENYIESLELKNKKKETYIEQIYKIEQNNIIDYQKETEEPTVIANTVENNNSVRYTIENNYNKNERKSGIINHKKNHPLDIIKQEKELDKIVRSQVEQLIKETSNENYDRHKNQILNFDE